jgi:uncharacterized protein
VRPAVVFDTSVLMSAVIWGGTPGRCLQLAREGRVEGVICAEILEELAQKLVLKLAFSSQQAVEVLGSLQLFLVPVVISGRMTGLCADPKDDMVLECALAAEATHVVSGDKKHLLSLKRFRGISIVSPAELLQAIGVAKA